MRRSSARCLLFSLLLPVAACTAFSGVAGKAAPLDRATTSSATAQLAPLAEDDIQSLLREDDYIITKEGKKVGSSIRSFTKDVIERRPESDGEKDVPVYGIFHQTSIFMGYMGGVINTDASIFDTIPPYPLLERIFMVQMAGPAMTTRIVREGGAYKAFVAQPDNQRPKESVIEGLRYTLGDALALQRWARSRPAKGARLEHRLIMATPSIQTPELAATVTDTKMEDVLGAKVNVISFRQTIPHGGGEETIEIDASGRIIRSTLNDEMTEEIASKEDALNEDYIDEWFDEADERISRLLGD